MNALCGDCLHCVVSWSKVKSQWPSKHQHFNPNVFRYSTVIMDGM